ncbi:probable inactive purple acid phosphatase 29 isoform X1 [Cajanus cajan]|uniref:probable inactive purple acid phosphatase 29 isoform X1 n=1 Tax=Cajanus cajan TaxID=3821 RepID=UPI0010FB48BE|nr:probable inactive purple acid phosphatase 29 isoform X1 [Cajanus cajan]
MGSQIPKTVMISSKRNVFGTKGKKGLDFLMVLVLTVSWFCLITTCVSATEPASPPAQLQNQKLRFDQNGKFKILQVADMHYANGKTTLCLDVLPSQNISCSDLNTTVFLNRMIKAEKPDLIVFTGDNIFGFDSSDSAKSMDAAFAPAIASNIPWVAILGNHDQEGTLSREGVMKYIVGMKNTLSKFNPHEVHTIDGFGNYNLEVGGVKGTHFENKSVLNLYFLDSGDYSKVPTIFGYDWIKPSQQLWFQRTSAKLRKAYISGPKPQKEAAPGLAYFHIPLPEYASFDSSNFTGVKLEPDGNGISSPSVNSGFFTTLVAAGDVKAVFTGHDHLNDFCGNLMNIQLCYAGGFGYHAYGKAGWPRRARVVVASLNKTREGSWGDVKSIKTWKRLDDQHLSRIDGEVLWSKSSGGLDSDEWEEKNHITNFYVRAKSQV